jgi:hypothetical protein
VKTSCTWRNRVWPGTSAVRPQGIRCVAEDLLRADFVEPSRRRRVYREARTTNRGSRTAAGPDVVAAQMAAFREWEQSTETRLTRAHFRESTVSSVVDDSQPHHGNSVRRVRRVRREECRRVPGEGVVKLERDPCPESGYASSTAFGRLGQPIRVRDRNHVVVDAIHDKRRLEDAIQIAEATRREQSSEALRTMQLIRDSTPSMQGRPRCSLNTGFLSPAPQGIPGRWCCRSL